MKHAIFLLLCLVGVTVAHPPGESPWWLYDESPTAETRLGDVRQASKIEITATVVRLLAERDGQLVSFYESKNPKTITQAKEQVRMAPSVCVPAVDGSYVMIPSIASVIITKRDGSELWVLRGLSVELGTVADAEAIKHIRRHLKPQ